MVSANLPSRFTTLDQTLQTAMVEDGLCCEEAANQLIAECLSPNRRSEMEEHIPGFNREWLTISGAETHRNTLLARTKVPKESWPAQPAPEPPKLFRQDTAQVVLRGRPITQATINEPGGTYYDRESGVDRATFYEANFKMEVADMTVEVTKNYHKLKQLQAECAAIWEGQDVQVTGLMLQKDDPSGERLVLADKWFPITEEADASA